MKKIEFSGETFYYDKGRFYDGLFIELPLKESVRVREYFLSTIDLKTLSFEEFLDLANDLDSGENYATCASIIENGFKLFFNQPEYARVMLPKLFKLYRLQNKPQKVIDEWQNYWSKNSKDIRSAALFIVIGAAYCDLGNIEYAKQFANRAYGMLNGCPNEYLSNLYKRINAIEQ